MGQRGPSEAGWTRQVTGLELRGWTGTPQSYPGLLQEQEAVFIEHRLGALQQLRGHGLELLIHCGGDRRARVRRAGTDGGVCGGQGQLEQRVV